MVGLGELCILSMVDLEQSLVSGLFFSEKVPLLLQTTI